MATYKINFDATVSVLRVGFGDPAQNDQLVRDAKSRIEAMLASGELPTGGGLRINGPASLPVACVLTHAVAHRFTWVGVFDPKLNKYVVAISHDPSMAVGDLVE